MPLLRRFRNNVLAEELVAGEPLGNLGLWHDGHERGEIVRVDEVPGLDDGLLEHVDEIANQKIALLLRHLLRLVAQILVLLDLGPQIGVDVAGPLKKSGGGILVAFL